MDASRIRQYVDDELTPHERAMVEDALEADPSLRAQVAFERSLRERVGKTLHAAQPEIPAEVRARVEQSLAMERNAPDLGADDADGAIPLRQPVAGSTRINVFAVAACLAIVAGAVLFGIFGEPFLRDRITSAPDGAVVGQAATEANAEHARCTPGFLALTEKLRYQTPTEIQQALAPRLGVAVPIVDLRPAGYVLVGGGECGLPPDRDHAIHLMYQRVNGAQRVSMFIQPDVGQYEGVSDEGRVYSAAELGLDGLDLDPAIWRDGERVYLLVACTPRDQKAALSALKPAFGLR